MKLIGMGDKMTEKEKITEKLKEISANLTKIVSDVEIKVIINSSERTISFLSHTFSIPNPQDKEKYITTWNEIFSVFNDEKEKIKRLKEIEIFKKQEEINKKKKEEEEKERKKIQDLSYTQNLSYIQNIIEKNSDFSEKIKEKPEEEIKPAKKEEKKEQNKFKYGIKISENDSMQNSDWFDIEDKNIDFVILTALRNGKTDRKFKTYLKKCKEHNLCSGAFFHGMATSINEAKREVTEIINLLEIYEVKGPVIYEINNKAVSDANLEKNIIELKKIYTSVKYILDELTKRGYSNILNVDLNTISTLVNLKIMTTKDFSLIYNVLPSQTEQIDDSCQIIEFNPKNDYEKMKISEFHFNKSVSNK